MKRKGYHLIGYVDRHTFHYTEVCSFRRKSWRTKRTKITRHFDPGIKHKGGYHSFYLRDGVLETWAMWAFKGLDKQGSPQWREVMR